MQDKHLFEYAVVRVVPRVEREEFMNVGVVLYAARERYLKLLFWVDDLRLSSFCGGCDIEEIKEYLKAFEKICNGEKNGGPIASLPIAERFRWLTATRSTMVQTSKVHPGLTNSAEETLQKLFEQLVIPVNKEC